MGKLSAAIVSSPIDDLELVLGVVGFMAVPFGWGSK
jgi:hypothetical protein